MGVIYDATIKATLINWGIYKIGKFRLTNIFIIDSLKLLKAEHFNAPFSDDE